MINDVGVDVGVYLPTNVLCFADGSRVTLRRATFKSCRATPLAVYGNNASIFLDYASFVGNIMPEDNTTDAGQTSGILVSSAAVTVHSSNCYGNIGQKTPPGVFWLSSSARLSILSSNFVGNRAKSGAVVSAWDSAQVSIEQSVFTSNVAMDYGGVIITGDTTNITIQQSQFERNTARSRGGAEC